MSQTLKCPCGSCGTNIEFPAEYSGQTVPCPSCSNQTLLAAPASNPRQTPENRTLGCPNCGAAHKPRQQTCEYCGAALMLTHSSGVLLDSVRLDSAEYERLRRSVREHPEDGAARYALGMAYLYRGLNTEALDELLKALQKMPESLEVAFNVAITLARSISYNQSSGEDYLRWQAFLGESSIFEAVKKITVRCVRFDPGFQEAVALAHVVESGVVGSYSVDQAMKEADMAVAACPELDLAHSRQGYLRLVGADGEGAAKSLTQCLALNPHEPEILMQLSEALLTCKRYGDSYRVAQQLEMVPTTYGRQLSDNVRTRLLETLAFGALGSSKPQSETVGAFKKCWMHVQQRAETVEGAESHIDFVTRFVHCAKNSGIKYGRLMDLFVSCADGCGASVEDKDSMKGVIKEVYERWDMNLWEMWRTRKFWFVCLAVFLVYDLLFGKVIYDLLVGKPKKKSR